MEVITSVSAVCRVGGCNCIGSPGNPASLHREEMKYVHVGMCVFKNNCQMTGLSCDYSGRCTLVSPYPQLYNLHLCLKPVLEFQ